MRVSYPLFVPRLWVQLRMALYAFGCPVWVGLTAEDVARVAGIEVSVAFSHIASVQRDARMLMRLSM